MNRTKLVPAAAAAALALAALALAAGGGQSTAARHWGGARVSAPFEGKATATPLPTSQCLGGALGPPVRCYSPAQFEKAYNLGALHAAGIDGRGKTIALIDSFGSPTIAADLHAFDQVFGVGNAGGVPVDPAIATDPTLTVIAPAGTPPPFDANNPDMVGWAQETTLDVEWAHVIAPRANILLVETPTSETEGVQGFPEIVTAENYVINNHLADVISQSFGATEQTFPDAKTLLGLRDAVVNAQRNNITVLGASGDEGSTDFQLNLSDLYTMPVNSWPSSDPLVTSIGGTQITLDDAGNRLTPDVVWNDGFGAGGGGLSSVFKRPDFQNGVRSVVGEARGTPDVSFDAAVNGGVWVDYSFVHPTSPFHLFGGTSAATPEFAGLVALADQVAGADLGTINTALYSIPYGGGLVDVTSGNNDLGPFGNSDGATYHVAGYNAAPGYDLASGLGTVDPLRFVTSLVVADCRAGGPGPAGPPGPKGPASCGGPGKNVECTSAMTFAAIVGDVHVRKGATCTLTDSAVGGTINVDNGGALTLNGVTVMGDLHAHGETAIGQDATGGGTVVQSNAELADGSGAVASSVCGATVAGTLDVHNNANGLMVGTSGSCAAGNSIGKDLHVHDNRVPGGGQIAIAGNTVGHNLDCQGNTPNPTGAGNTAGHKSGQCTSL